MRYIHKNKGTCSQTVSFDMDDDGIITNISFEGGCHGNLQGIAALGEGMSADKLIDALKGIKCGFKSTSCPDQLADAVLKARNGNI